MSFEREGEPLKAYLIAKNLLLLLLACVGGEFVVGTRAEAKGFWSKYNVGVEYAASSSYALIYYCNPPFNFGPNGGICDIEKGTG